MFDEINNPSLEENPQVILAALETEESRHFRHSLEEMKSLIEACARETLEEAAFYFKPLEIVGVYMSRFQRANSAEPSGQEDITYLRFAFCGELGEHVAGQALDDGIVRTVWLTADEIRACAQQHRSPLLLKCLDDFLAGQRFPLALVSTDISVFSV